MITSFFVVLAAIVAVGSAFVLKHLERHGPPRFGDSSDRFSKRQIYRITEELSQRVNQ